MLKKLTLSLLVGQVILAACLAAMFLWAGTTSLGAEQVRILKFTACAGFALVGLAWLFCTPLAAKHGRLASVTAGTVIGLLTPAFVGWVWATLLKDPWVGRWAYLWTGLDAWGNGLTLTIPGAIAGAAVGSLQASRK
jgi:hypothetical protein